MTRVPTSWCRCQGTKLHNPWRNEKVYILSLRTDRRSSDSKFAVLFVLETPLSNFARRWLHWERTLALRSIHTRRFRDPDPPRVVDNPERILRKGSTPIDKGISHLQRDSSLPTESVKGFTSFDFDKETDQSFPRSKSETELCQVLTSLERPNLFWPAQQPSHPSTTFVGQRACIMQIWSLMVNRD